jgi:hypothetical protein
MVYIIDFIIYDIVFYEFPIEIPFCLFGFRSAMMRPGPPPRAAARGDRLRKAKTRGFSDRQIAQLVTAPDAGRIFNGDGETSGTWGVHQPEYKIFHWIHMENPLEKPYWKW